MKKPTKILTVAILLVLVAASLTFAISTGGQHSKLIAIEAGSALSPTGVNNTLNITFSDINYVTNPPALQWGRMTNYTYHGSYTGIAPKASTATVAAGLNSTYQILMTNTTTAMTGASVLSYNYSKVKGKNTSYFFTESRLALNDSAHVTLNYAISYKVLATPGTLLSAASNKTVAYIDVSSGVPELYVAEATGPKVVTFTKYNGFSGTLSDLTFYEMSMYLTKSKLTAAIYDTSNGKELGVASSTISRTSNYNYSDINVTSYQFQGTSNRSAFILDWGYVANHNSFSSTGTTPSYSASPFIAGDSSFVSTTAPFDPGSVNASYKEAPNVTGVHVDTKVGNKQFTGGVLSSNNTSVVQSAMLNTSYVINKMSKGNQSLNSSAGFQSVAVNKQNNGVVNANIHVSVWNSTGIKTAVTDFLKNYSATQATINTQVSTSSSEITLMGYTVSNVQLSTNLTASNAKQVRNYFDNGFASLLKKYNFSLVDTNTTSIVAGAFAGDFYYQGQAYVPIIQGSAIINPITMQRYDSPEAAGFAAGAHISGGAVIVPQYSILGFSFGSPIFAQGLSFSSLTGSITSAGQAVSSWFGNGASSISNAIGSVKSTATNYLVKPITSTASSATKTIEQHYSSLQDGISNLTNTIAPTIGAIPSDISSSVTSNLGPIAGDINKVSDQLGSMKQSLVTSVAAGYSGLKSNIDSLSSSVSKLPSYISATVAAKTQGMWNTLGNYVNDSKAVLSAEFTAVKNLPGTVKNDLASLSSSVKGTIGKYSSELMNMAGTYYKDVTGKIGSIWNATKNTFGSITNKIVGAGNSLISGAKSAFSMIVSFGHKLGYILEIAGITIAAVVIAGIVIYFGFIRKPANIVQGAAQLAPFFIPVRRKRRLAGRFRLFLAAFFPSGKSDSDMRYTPVAG